MDKDDNKDVDLDKNDEELDLDLEDEDKADDQTDWKAEALKYKSIAKRYKTKLDKPTNQEKKPDQKEDISGKESRPSDMFRADEFKLYRQGYTEDEIDLIMHNGGMKALQDEKSPLVMGLRAAKEQRQAEQAANSVNDSAGLSEVERKYTTEQLKNMTVKELEAILPHAN